MESFDWVFLNYTLPRDPLRARASVWRKLKIIGAVNVQQSIWLLPLTAENFNNMSALRDEVLHCDGDALVMQSRTDETGTVAIMAKFSAARNEEYGELLEGCEDFRRNIDKETARENFTFAEIEQNEEELNKLREWYGRILARDCFGASLRGECEAALDKCGEALDRFCSAVYARQA